MLEEMVTILKQEFSEVMNLVDLMLAKPIKFTNRITQTKEGPLWVVLIVVILTVES